MHRYINRFSSERNYDDLVNLIYAQNIKYVGGIIHLLQSDNHPTIYAIEIKNNENEPYVFLSAGVHGDEPAGISALIEFIKEAGNYNKNFIILPCVNPVGYEKNIREGSEFQDINREFYYDTKSPENISIIKFLANQKNKNYLFSMDLHETRAPDKNDSKYSHNMLHPDGFYMFEVCRDKNKCIGAKIIQEVSFIMPICQWAKIWGDVANNGLISYPEGATGKLYSEAHTFEKYMHDNYTQHSFTTETYSGKYGGNGESFEERVKVQLTAIKTALTHII